MLVEFGNFQVNQVLINPLAFELILNMLGKTIYPTYLK